MPRVKGGAQRKGVEIFLGWGPQKNTTPALDAGQVERSEEAGAFPSGFPRPRPWRAFFPGGRNRFGIFHISGKNAKPILRYCLGSFVEMRYNGDL